MSNSEHPPSSIHGVLSRLRTRQRWLQAMRLAARGVFYGGLLAVVVAAAGTLAQADWMQSSPWSVFWCVPLVVAVAAMLGLLFPVDSLRVARAMDRAAASEDRLASALQLAGHHRRARARLVVEDALSAVRGVPVESALPLRAPAELKWLPLPALALAALFWLSPSRSLDAQIVEEPEVTSEQWTDLNEDLRRRMEELPEPKTPEEEAITERLEKLASFLQQRPSKKEALARIAELREQLEKRRQGLAVRNLSIRQAAQALRSSDALERFASQLRQGNYRKAAEALTSLADRLKQDAARLTAADFEAVASDFDRLASEVASHKELGHACRNCANAASTMNRDKLANALMRLAKKLQENADDLSRCDSLCRSCGLLDDLKRRLGLSKRCGSCKKGNCSGCGNRFVRRNDKKGGLKAGWGTASTWDRGSLTPQRDQRLPVMAPTRERDGRSTAYTIVSKEERAESALDYQEVYAEMVQKAEADLSLETVPIAYRDFLRRYFLAIRPQEDGGPTKPED